MMRHMPLYTDLVFCIVLLPLMIIAFPVERWWATAPVYFCLFVLWLYTTYFLYSHYVVPGLFRNRRRRIAAIVCIVVSLFSHLSGCLVCTSCCMQRMLMQRYIIQAENRLPVFGINLPFLPALHFVCRFSGDN